GGWIVMDKSFQDLDFFTNYKCTGRLRASGASASPAVASAEAGTCKAGVLLRAQKLPDGGMRGVYFSLTEGDVFPYSVTLDAQGKEVSRERIAAPARAGGAGGAGGGRAAGPPPSPVLKAGDWNPIEVIVSAASF